MFNKHNSNGAKAINNLSFSIQFLYNRTRWTMCPVPRTQYSDHLNDNHPIFIQIPLSYTLYYLHLFSKRALLFYFFPQHTSIFRNFTTFHIRIRFENKQNIILKLDLQCEFSHYYTVLLFYLPSTQFCIRTSCFKNTGSTFYTIWIQHIVQVLIGIYFSHFFYF